MTDIDINHHETEAKWRHVATVDNVLCEGEMTCSKASPTMIIVDHTAEPDSMRGLGVASVLARRVIADARDAGQKNLPQCSFFSQLRKPAP